MIGALQAVAQPDIAATAGLGAMLTLVVIAIIKALPIWRRIEVDAGHAKATREDTTIEALRRQIAANDADCHTKLDLLNNRVIVVAQAAMELSSVVERHDPTAPALARARSALEHAFPLSFTDINAREKGK